LPFDRAYEQLYSPREVAYNNTEQYKQKQDRTEKRSRVPINRPHCCSVALFLRYSEIFVETRKWPILTYPMYCRVVHHAIEETEAGR